ncbi:MAG: type I-U CRISPR-associated protein Csx17, partial [Pirellula sp.]|nr:type I-U CRISPR-associated protein Csx17 [Pirellula sp.]
MSDGTYTINLKGCSPTPLAHYLKALGIFRIIAEQADANALGWWKNDSFWLQSNLDEEALQRFFLSRYCPTPLVAPWNGGSGFNPKDNKDAMTAILGGSAERFSLYRNVIVQCQTILLNNRDEIEKALLLQQCRNVLPDEVVTWLDAAYVLTGSGPKYPPLLGTGGNDGRLEFTNNFMQHLIAVVNPDLGAENEKSLLRLSECVFGDLSNCRHRGTIGQYDPGNLGGSNSGSGFDGYSTVNSWDYVLMLEGAIMFAAASTKRLESGDSGALAYPFCVRPAGIGYGSSSVTDEGSSRAEMWLPLWNQQTRFPAITTLLSEGRVETRKRKAKNGVDFARAIASLGIDRGINEFQRYGFQQRNGLAYLAVPLGRFRVKSQPGAEELLAPLDNWLDRFRRAATGKNAPA